jgi:hypothetical protein
VGKKLTMLGSCGVIATTGEKVLGNVVDVRVQLAAAAVRTAPMLFVQRCVGAKFDLSSPTLKGLLHVAQVRARNLGKMYY